MAEVSLYISYKARAKLYLESQMNKQQQEQLSNLLDTVPDSVVIFSKNTEAHTAKVLYANRRINAFFGENIKVQ